MIHIMFIVPYQSVQQIVEEVFLERPNSDEISHEIIVVNPGEIVTIKPSQADVVISRGFTAASLITELPNVELTVTGYDVVLALNECVDRFHCTKIAIVGTHNMIYGVESINELYSNLDISSMTLGSEEKLSEAIARVVQNGAQAVLGGRSVCRAAQQAGIPSVMFRLGKETVGKAVDEAVRAVQIKRRERVKSDQIETIMNYTFEGILSTDENGIITLANKYARATLSARNNGDVVGMQLLDCFPDLPLHQVLGGNERILSEIYKLENMTVSINCIPLRSNDQVVGSVTTFQDVTRIQEEEGKIRKQMHKKGFIAKYRFDHILWESNSMRDTIRIAKRFAGSDSNLLIFGETGTGKELFAQSIHNESQRRNGPFVAINCAALPEQLLESELFGYVEGAFTGAAKGGKMGLFEIAHNGTIFLDEIGDVSPKLQARLLRVIQEREIIRLGDDRVIPINVRIISATNKDLMEQMENGSFRLDLLYRLEVLYLSIPPLRERGDDILLLIDHYIRREQRKIGCVLREITPEAIELVLSYAWPGNVRELRNFCERICVLCENEVADSSDIILELGAKRRRADYMAVPSTDDFLIRANEPEKEALLRALKACNFSRKDTATVLKIDKSTLWRRMKKYGIKL